jgi:hypothetical protein
MGSRARFTNAAGGPSTRFFVADSTPGCGRVGAIASAAWETRSIARSGSERYW